MSKMIPELRPLLHIANLLTSEMVHFIHQLAYYITFEVRKDKARHFVLNIMRLSFVPSLLGHGM
jgi:hypothetical protein